jgi:hypothetical protein
VPPGILADADTSRVRRQFYDRAMGGELAEGFDTWWWWIRGERIADDGGLYLIAEDEENGDLYKIPVSTSGEDIEFDAPVKVVIDYKTAAARAAAVAGMRVADDKIRVHASRADTGGPDPSTRKGASAMDETRRKALAAALGLPENATLAQIKAASDEQLAQGVEGGEPENAGMTGSEVTPADQPPADQTPPGTAPSGTHHNSSEEQVAQQTQRATEGQPDNPDAPDAEAGFVRVDKATWEQTQRGAALAISQENERVAARQKDKVSAAVKAAKIPPARRKHYETLMAMDEEGTTALLDSLAASAVPLGAGNGSSGNGGEEIAAGGAEGLPDNWFPEIGEKRARVAAGVVPVVTQAKEG